MDSSFNGLLLLHFARLASNLAVFNYFIIWNSTFFYYYFILLPLQNFNPVQRALGYFEAQRRWKFRIASHTQTIIKWGLQTDLSVSGCPSSVNFIPKSVLLSSKSAKKCCSAEQEDRSAWKYFFSCQDDFPKWSLGLPLSQSLETLLK